MGKKGGPARSGRAANASSAAGGAAAAQGPTLGAGAHSSTPRHEAHRAWSAAGPAAARARPGAPQQRRARRGVAGQWRGRARRRSAQPPLEGTAGRGEHAAKAAVNSRALRPAKRGDKPLLRVNAGRSRGPPGTGAPARTPARRTLPAADPHGGTTRASRVVRRREKKKKKNQWPWRRKNKAEKDKRKERKYGERTRWQPERTELPCKASFGFLLLSISFEDEFIVQ